MLQKTSAWKDPLMHAVEKKDCEEIKKLLENGHPADGSVIEEYAPIHLAVIQNNSDYCEILLRNGACVNQTDSYGLTPLHRAASETICVDVFKLLVSFGADVNAKTPSRTTPLHFAAEHGELEKLRYLLGSPKIEVDVTDKFERNALHCLLFDNKRDSHSLLPEVNMLLQKGLSINAQDHEGNTALDYVSCNLIEELVNFGSDLAIKDRKGDNYINRHMIRDLYCSTDPFLQTFLRGQLKSLSKEDTKKLIDSKGSGGQTPFLRACARALAKDLEMFLEAGADILSVDNLHRTALHIMSRELWVQDIRCVNTLLKWGAKVNEKDIFGRIPLYKIKITAIAKMLLEHNADISCTDQCRRTPLVALMENGNVEILSDLVKMGTDINAKDKYGSSPLHYAVWHNNTDIVKLMLENGGDITALDDNGYSPEEYAMKLGNRDVLELLQSHLTEATSVEIIYDRMKGTEEDNPVTGEFPVRSRPLPLIDYYADPNSPILEKIPTPKNHDKFAMAVLNVPGIGKLAFEESLEINRKICGLMKRICLKLEENDGRFASTIFQSGSMAEGSKCGDPEEFDFVCCLNNFAKISIIVEDEFSSTNGFARLILNDKNARESFDIFFNDDGNINIDQVLNTFLALLSEVIMDREIWTDNEIVFDGEIRNVVAKPILNMSVTWVGAVYKNLKISVDIVPAVRKNGWWPKQSNMTSLPFVTEEVKREGCMLLVQSGPKEHITSDHLRVSFAPAEITYFKGLPPVLKDSYILAKAMRNECVCPPIDFDGNKMNLRADNVISSYMLKTCLFHAISHCLLETPICQEDERTGGRYLVRVWAMLIYEILKICTEKDNLPAFFLATHNVFTFSDTFLTSMSWKELWPLIIDNNLRRKIFVACLCKRLGC